jgi:hypothetical protein
MIEVDLTSCPKWTETMKKIAREMGVPVRSLISPDDDPFYWTPSRLRRARWAKDVFDETFTGTPIYSRDIHYKTIGEIVPWSEKGSSIYSGINDTLLTHAFRDARYLGLIPWDGIVDMKNDETRIQDEFWSGAKMQVSPGLKSDLWVEFNHPRSRIITEGHDRPYLVEVWSEKYSSHLVDLQREYGFNLQILGGMSSLTRTHECYRRITATDRPTRIFWLTDFGPEGRKMPGAMSRQLEFLLMHTEGDHDVQVDRILLTSDQIIDFNLPPQKKKSEKAKRGGKELSHIAEWNEKHGGTVELNALSGRHPDEFRQIIIDAISPFIPEDYRDDEIEREWKDKFPNDFDGIDDLEERIDDLRSRYDDLVSEWQEVIEEWKGTLQTTEYEIEFDQDHRLDDPIFDSSRDFVTQLLRYPK